MPVGPLAELRPWRELPRLAIAFTLALLLLNSGLSWWRNESAPSVAGYDEAMINDAAIGVARFGELRAPSMEGTPLGKVYALYMPGYLLLQGALFHAFGLTPLTLRITSKVPHLAICALGLVILLMLWRRRVVSTRIGIVMAILWLSDIAGFWIGRQARPDPLEELFGLTACWLLLLAPERPRSWWVASVLMGFALSTHASAIVFWMPFVFLLWHFRARLGWFAAIGCAVLPVLILIAFWLGGHRGHSLEALEQFRVLNSYRTDKGFDWGRWGAVISSGFAVSRKNFALLLPIGGLSYVVMMAGWVLAFTRFRQARTNNWIAFALVCSVAHVLCAQFVTGVYAQRVLLYYPFALLALGVALTSLGRRWEIPALALAAVVAAGQFAAMYGYVTQGGDKSLDRFDALHLPADVHTVASTTELWFYFVSRGLPFRIIAQDRPTYGDYWLLHPEHFDNFDAVILPADDEMLRWPQLANRPKHYFNDFTGPLVICLRNPVPATRD